ncbi:MAG: hypothetical protein Q4G39_10175 [Brachymonas sp.]|nr:hypothetical protein [Brachymonas sp.]
MSIEELPLNHDFYHNVAYDKKYNILLEPKDLVVGQLYDDWDFIKPILDDVERVNPTLLSNLAALLEYFATQADWYPAKDSKPA